MTAPGFTLFDTAIGRCGIAWGERGIVAVQLPEGDDARTRARLARRCPGGTEGSPPAAVADAIAGITALMEGQPVDLSPVVLDLDGLPAFDRGVYDVARAIPPGETLTYGAVAARLGDPGAARAVGAALGRNPFPIVVPCHRVIAADGTLGGFSAEGGATTKHRLLAIERAPAAAQLALF